MSVTVSKNRQSLLNRFGLPEGFFILALIGLLLMFDFSTVSNTLLLYTNNTFGFNQDQAWLLYRSFLALCCLSPVLGGFLSQQLLSLRFGMLLGLLLLNLSLYVLCFHQASTLYLGLSGFVVGLGLITPVLLMIFHRLYQGMARKRAVGFILFFVSVSLGSLLSSYIAIPIANDFGFQGCFLLSAIATMLAGLLFIPSLTPFIASKSKMALPRLSIPDTQYSTLKILFGLFFVFSSVFIALKILNNAIHSNALLIFFIFLIVGFLFAIYREGSPAEKQKLSVLYTLLLFSAGFWALYMFLPSLLTLYIEKDVKTATSLLNLDPLLLILLGAVLLLVHRYHNNQKTIQEAYQFALAILCVGIAFLSLDGGIYWTQQNGQGHWIWIIFSDTLQTIAQVLMLSTGTTLIVYLAPKVHQGFMLGLWIFTIQVGNSLAGLMMDFTYQHLNDSFLNLSDHFYASNFTRFGVMALTLGIISALLAPRIQAVLEY